MTTDFLHYSKADVFLPTPSTTTEEAVPPDDELAIKLDTPSAQLEDANSGVNDSEQQETVRPVHGFKASHTQSLNFTHLLTQFKVGTRLYVSLRRCTHLWYAPESHNKLVLTQSSGLDTTITADIQAAASETLGHVDKLTWVGTGFLMGSLCAILPAYVHPAFAALLVLSSYLVLPFMLCLI